MPGTAGWAAQVLSQRGGLSDGLVRTRRILLGWASLPGIGGSQADGRGPLGVVASLAAVLDSLGPQHPVCRHRICLAFFHRWGRSRRSSHNPPRTESVLMRHQVLILNRGRKRAPNLRVSDRIIAGLCTLLMRPARVLRSAVALKPSTLLHFHKMLTKQKYRLLFSPKRARRPGPKGPTKELIDAVVEMKRRNLTWGCKRIAQQVALAFGVDIDKDVVRRILGIHFQPEAGSGGPSWLTFIGHAKDSLWSLDLFRCESAFLRTYWVLVVMDQFTRRIVGFAV